MRVFVPVILMVMLLAGCSDSVSDSYHIYEKDETYSIKYTGQKLFMLQGTNGNITIGTAANPGVIRIELTKRVVSTASADDAMRHIGNISAAWNNDDEKTQVTVTHPQNTSLNYSVDFHIICPDSLNYHLRTGNGNITLSSTVQTLGLDIGNGNAEADLILIDPCTVEIAVGNGNTACAIPKTANAELNATVGNGTVRFSALTFSSMQKTGKMIEGVLGDGSGNIVIAVGNGNITLQGK